MAATGNVVTTIIITGGLTCGATTSACKHGIITAPFSLYHTSSRFQGVGGGPYPGDAWNKFDPGDFEQFYQEIPDALQYYVVPKDQEANYFTRSTHIVLKVKIGDFEVEKEYVAASNGARAVINILNVLETTRSKISVATKALTNIKHNIAVGIKNMLVKK